MGRATVYGIIVGIALVVVALAAIAMVLYVIYYYVFAGLFAPTRRVMAQVVLKRQRQRVGGDVSWFADRENDPMGYSDEDADLACDFFAVFEADGKRLEFAVPMSVYVDLDQGDTGILIHKGNLFRGFIKGAAGWSDPIPSPIQQVEP